MKNLLLFALLSSVSAFGQAYSDSVTQNSPGNYGRPVPYASVQVCNIADTATPCTQKVSTFTNDSLGVACTQSAGSGVLTGAPVSGANCNNPGIADANGNFTIYVVPGQYRICTYANNWLCQNVSIGGSGGGIPFACASAVNGSIVAMTSTITSSCDPNGITDFIGHWTSQSYRATGTHNGTVELTGGLADPTNPPDTNSVAFLAPLTVPTPYYVRPPSSVGTVGQLLNLASQVISTNGTIDALGWLNAVTTINGTPCSLGSTCSITVGGTVEFQTNSVDNLNCTAGACPLQNIVSGTNTTVTNISGGNVRIDATGGQATTQISTPTAPTLSTNGSAGATSRTYAIVACEDVACVKHTAASSTTTIATTNATLSSSNSVNLSAYADTLHGPRCLNVYRTASAGTPSTTGLIATCVGKKFVDTGFAGDGTTAPVSNNTVLEETTSPLPGCNIPLDKVTGPDAVPCAPNAMDDEFQQTFQVPGDVNNTFWTWGNQQGASASWSGGMLIFNTDTLAQNEYLTHSVALPATPFTFLVYLDTLTNASGGNGQACFIGLRESATGKMTTWEINHTQPDTSQTSAGGNMWVHKNWTTNSAHTDVKYVAYATDGAYLKIQDDGTNINVLASNTGDGVLFHQFSSETVVSAFTTAPNQLIIGGQSLSGQVAQCGFDFERRTQ